MEKRNVVYTGNPGVIVSAAKALADNRASGAYIVEVVTYAQTLAVERGHVRNERLHMDEKDLTDSVERVIAMLGIDNQTEKSLVEQEGLLKWGNWQPGAVLKQLGGE